MRVRLWTEIEVDEVTIMQLTQSLPMGQPMPPIDSMVGLSFARQTEGALSEARGVKAVKTVWIPEILK